MALSHNPDFNGTLEVAKILKARRIRRALLAGTALVAVSLAVVAAPQGASAQIWDGETNTLWTTGQNWNNNAVPAAGDNVEINGAGGANQPVVNANQTVTSVIVTGGSLTVDATLTSPVVKAGGAGTITINAGRVVDGKVGVNGTGQLFNNGSITGGLKIVGGTAMNAGSVGGQTFVTGGELQLNAGSNLANNAGLTVDGGILQVNVNENVGKLLVSEGGTVFIADGKTLRSASSITTDTGGTINIGAGAALRGDGNTLNNGSTINVGNAGVVSDAGNINNLATGVINFNGAAGLSLMVSGTNVIDNKGQINFVGAGNVQINGNVTNHGTDGVFNVQAGAGNVGIVGNLNNNFSGTVNVLGGALTVGNTLTNNSVAPIGVSIAEFASVNALNVVNNGDIQNAGLLSSTSKIANSGTLSNVLTGFVTGGIDNTGAVFNAGDISGGIDNKAGGLVQTTGVVTGGLTNAGTVLASGGVDGPIVNNNVFVVQGDLIGLGSFTNNDPAQLLVTGGDFTGITTLTNNSKAGVVLIDADRTLSAGAIVNNLDALIVNSGTLTSGTKIANSGQLINNSVLNGGVDNKSTGNLVTSGVLDGGVTNAGTVTASGAINGAIVNNGAGVFIVGGNLAGAGAFTNSDTAELKVSGGSYSGITTLTNTSKITIAPGKTLYAGTINNNGGQIDVGVGARLQGTGNTLNNNAVINVATNGIVADAGAINNLAAGVINFNGPGGLALLASGTNVIANKGAINVNSGNVQINGNVTNSGTGSLTLGAGAGNVGVTGNLTHGGSGMVDVKAGQLTVGQTLTNNSTGFLGIITAAGAGINATAIVNNTGFIDNSGTLSSATKIANASSLFNYGTGVVNGGVVNTGFVSNAGAINGGIDNKAAGTVQTFGVVNNGVTNRGIFDAQGQVNGPIDNLGGGVFTVTGALTGTGAFTNSNTAQLLVSGGDFTGLASLTNNASGLVKIDPGFLLSAGSVTNNAAATINNRGTLTSVSKIVNAGTISNTGTINGGIDNKSTGILTTVNTVNGGLTNAGVVNASGGINGAIVNTGSGLFTVTGNLAGNSTFANNGAARLAVTGGDFTGITTLTNASSALGVNVAAGKALSANAVINNAGSTIVNAGTLTSVTKIANAGTLTNSGGVNGGVNNTGALNNTGTVNGGVANTGAGVVTTSGVINGGLTNANKVLASGQVNGAIVNNGLFTVTGALTGDNTLSNGFGGVLNVTGGDFTGLTTLTNLGGAVNVAAGRTLSATTAIANNAGVFTSGGTVSAPTIGNIGTMNLAGTVNAPTAFNNAGLVNLTGNVGGAMPAFNNTANGRVNLNNRQLNGVGTLTNAGVVTAFGTGNAIGGGVVNNNLITLQNSFGVPGANMAANSTNDQLTIGGAYTGAAGSLIALDANLAAPTGAGRGDRVTITGASAGLVDVRINPTSLGAALTDGITVLGTAGGLNPANVRVNGASRTNPFASNGIVNYFLVNVGNDYQIQSTVNLGPAMGIASGLSGALGTLQSGFHQPVSAIVSKPEGCGPDQTVGGLFIRANGGSTDTTLDGVGSGPGLAGAGAGTVGSRTNTSSTFGGFQAGFDLGKCNIGNSGWDMHFGVMAGMVDVKMASSNVTTNALGGAATTGTRADISVPFVGAYTFLRNGGFTIEANIRQDYYRAQISSTSGGINFVPTGTKLTGEGTSFSGQLSYRFTVGDRFFFEPQVGFSYGVTDFGLVNMYGVGGPMTPPVARITLDRANSQLGRIGLLAGTTMQITEKLYGAPFVQGFVWREFGDPTTATTTLTASGQQFLARTERVGTFGQIGGGLQLRLLDSAFSGFVRGDMRFGDKIDGVAINVGLRGHFTTQ